MAASSSLTPRQLARRADATATEFRVLAESEDFSVRKALARNRSVPDDVLLEILTDDRARIAYLVCSRARLSAAVGKALARHPDNEVRCHLAQRADLPEAIQRMLARDKVVHVQYALLKRQLLSDDVLTVLARHSDPLVRNSVAKRPDVPAAALSMLALDTDPGVCRVVSTSNRAPTSVLDHLAEHPDTSVRVGVAQNARSSSATRVLLSNDPDEEVRYSAMYQAYLAKDAAPLAAHVHHPDVGFRWTIAGGGDAESVTALLRDVSPRVRWTAAARGFATPAQLMALARDHDPTVRDLVAGLATLPSKVVTLLAKDTEASVRTTIATRTDLSSLVRTRLLNDEDNQVRWFAGRPSHPDAPQAVATTRRSDDATKSPRSRALTEAEMIRIVESGETTRLRRLAKNTALTHAVRLRLTDCDDFEVRASVASSRLSSEDVLAQLLLRHDSSIDRLVARNTSVPLPKHPRTWPACAVPVRQDIAARQDLDTTLISALSTDVSPLVRLEVATNRSTPSDVLRRLASDDDHMVRAAVASNPHTPTAALRQLASDPTYETRMRLTKRLRHLDSSTRRQWSTNHRARHALAKSPLTPRDLLLQLIEDDSQTVAAEAAQNYSTPAPAVELLLNHPAVACRHHAARRATSLSDEQALALARDPSWWVREAIAQNRVTPTCALDVLLPEKTLSIRVAIAWHPNASTDALDLLAHVWSHQIHSGVAYHPRALPSTLDHLARDRSVWTRRTVARNSNTAISTLGRLGRDRSEWVREAAAANPHTHVGTLRRLASDSAPRVRAAVAGNPLASGPLLERLAQDPEPEVRAALLGR